MSHYDKNAYEPKIHANMIYNDVGPFASHQHKKSCSVFYSKCVHNNCGFDGCEHRFCSHQECKIAKLIALAPGQRHHHHNNHHHNNHKCTHTVHHYDHKGNKLQKERIEYIENTDTFRDLHKSIDNRSIDETTINSKSESSESSDYKNDITQCLIGPNSENILVLNQSSWAPLISTKEVNIDYTNHRLCHAKYMVRPIPQILYTVPKHILKGSHTIKFTDNTCTPSMPYPPILPSSANFLLTKGTFFRIHNIPLYNTYNGNYRPTVCSPTTPINSPDPSLTGCQAVDTTPTGLTTFQPYRNAPVVGLYIGVSQYARK